MTRRLAVFALVACVVGADRVSAQLPPEQALASLKAADGLQVELFAAEPMVLNPTSMDVDHHGRVWVAEAVNYRRRLRKQPLLRGEGDRIVVLIDTDADGKADESKTFYQGADLYGPLSVCVIPQADAKALRVLVAQSPDILEFRDTDGDLKADGPPTKFLTGFGGFDHDHGVHGLSVGPDGKLYFTVGDQGIKGLQSADKTGPVYKSNDTDLRAGTVWRCDLDGKNVEPIAHNFRNNYEACVNSFGEIWCSDNDDDGNQQTRICFVMPGGDYGYHPRGKGESHWHEEKPGVVHKALRTGFGSPTGICFYEGDLLPEKYRGQLFHTDAGPRELRCFHITPKGAGYELAKENLVTSADNWFRPSDVCVAPDGSVFVCDWYDPGVGGHGMGDWTRGRVYRVTPKGHVGYKVPAVELLDLEKLKNSTKPVAWKETLVANFMSPCVAVRALTFEQAKGLGDYHLARPLYPFYSEDDNKIVLHARLLQADGSLHFFAKVAYLGLFDLMPGAQLMFQDPRGPRATEMHFRNMARHFTDPRSKRIMGLHWQKFDKAFIDLLTAAPASVRREALLAFPAVQMNADVFYALAKLYDGEDVFYRAALNIALGTDPKQRHNILYHFDKHFPEWNDTVADLVWELRPKSVLPRLDKLLADGTLTGPQKARIVDILAASDDPAAGKTLLKLLTADAPVEVKASALANLRLFLPTKWNALATGDDLKATIDALLTQPATRTTGLQLVAAANAVGRAEAVSDIALDRKADPTVRGEAVRTLGQLRSRESVDALADVMCERDDPLAAAAAAALGDLVTGRGDDPISTAALEYLRNKLLKQDNEPAELLRAILSALAGSRTGADFLLDLKEKGEFPAALVADAGRLLRNSPFQGQRNKALILFPAPGKLDPKKLPPIADLARRVGNPEKGRALLAKSVASEAQCLKCHLVRGQGGAIGPDLSMVGQKGSLENLFESVLQPSKAIADQYVSWKIDTVDGQSLVGLIVSESESTVVLRDANGKDYPIPVADIDGRSKSPVSLMPDNLAAALTEDELVDVVAFLKTLQTPSLTPSSWQLAGPFPAASMAAALATKFPPEAGPFDQWQTITASANGYIDLAARHGEKAANAASYLRCAIESPADQDATVLLGTDDGAKLWVNGEEVWHADATRPAAPDQDRVAVKLKTGTNAVLLKVANGGNPHGFHLTVTSVQELKRK